MVWTEEFECSAFSPLAVLRPQSLSCQYYIGHRIRLIIWLLSQTNSKKLPFKFMAVETDVFSLFRFRQNLPQSYVASNRCY